MVRRTFFLFATVAFLALPAVSVADEAPKPEAKPKFHVYGGLCSRSIQLQGTYDDVEAAIKAAVKARETFKQVTIRTGASDVLAKDYFGSAPTEYQIYRRGARCGQWNVVKTEQDATKALQAIKDMNTSFSPAELIYVYTAKK